MSNNKYNDHPILSWMKDLERKKLAVSLTSLLQQVSDDWSVDDSHKAIGMLEKWVYPMIDQNKLLQRNAFGDDLTFTFHVTHDVHSDELFDHLQEYHPEKWNHIRHVMLKDPVVEITYEDRYINTPLGCILLAQFIRRIRDLYMLSVCNCTISLSKRDFRVKFDDEDLKLDRRFSFAEHRDKFMMECINQIVRDKIKYEVKNLSHTRSMRVFNKLYELSIIPEGGIAHGWGIENGKHSELTTKDLGDHLDINLHCFNRNAHRHDKSGVRYTVHFELLKEKETHF